MLDNRRHIRRRWFIAAGLVLAALIFFLPSPDLYATKPVSQAVYDERGSLLRLTISADEKYRLRIKLRDIAPVFQKATLLYEDRYFYQHSGINPLAIIKAAWTTYIAGSARVGASTITMQLARLRFDIQSQHIPGKLYQILRAIQLELHYSKDEILEAYLNLAPYGGNIEGIAAASLIYFNKTADRLTLHEALTLAVIPQSPAYRSLDKGSNNPGLIRARDELIERWLEAYPESNAKAELLRLPLQAHDRKAIPFHAPHFVEAWLRTHTEQDNHTSLDLRLQQLLERNINNFVERNRKQGIYNATAVLLDYRDMTIKAMVGSADYFNERIHGQVNGTLARRSPGSTLKPFIFGLGLQQGLLHARTMLKDAPSSFGAYNPENYDRDFAGPISVTEALIKSRNVPAVAIAAQLANPDLYDFLQQADVDLPKSKEHYGLSLVLGGAEVSMLTLVKLYAMLANKGQLQELRWDNQPQSRSQPKQILSEAAAHITLSMLGGNPRPGHSFENVALQQTMPVYWKTGTSYGFRDAWSIGIFGPYVLAVWVGNFQGDGNPALIGRKTAGMLFFRIVDALRTVYPDISRVRIYQPDSVKQVKVCALSGEIAHKFCPVKENAGFIPGVSPITKCHVHRLIYIDQRTGLRACKPGKKVKQSLYEFWSSDLLSVFREAGIARRLPPPFLPECRQHNYTVDGLKPKITSPLKNVTYIYRPNKKKDRTIALSAITDADVKTLYWFVNESFLGKTDTRTPYYWQSTPGNFKVRVIDDHGRADLRELVVEVGQ
ncbi:MAG: penicillin-binding protein 1C [Gammaproteobacteria bacterium]|nr:penicillin-binding protein 1C [Gammaproteobacteria bacterium]MDH5651988.1 penicillin-binding protein 1C [Gammaproteobacteria bacterium]